MRNDDLISRSALKEALCISDLKEMNIAVDGKILERLIDCVPTVGGWISVKDELPKVGDLVLFTGLSSFGTRFITQRGWFDGTFWERDDGETVYPNTPVTHWMPLPDLPKEDDNA